MLKPRGDYVMLERLEAKGKSEGGILLPDNAKTKTNCGKVLAVGPGRLSASQSLTDEEVKVEGIEVGDIAHFLSYSGSEIEENGKTYLFIREGDILAIEAPR